MTGPARDGRLDACAVVVPARNEETYLARCLSAVDAARREVLLRRPELEVEILVVLDRCTDRSAEIVASFPTATAVAASVGNVGAARRLGCASALALLSTDPAGAWLACTDADSSVPVDWLSAQLEFAAAGADLVLGTVVPDYDHVTGVPFLGWQAVYAAQEGHPHVHGANLGIRGDTYVRAGGFRALVEHEDVALVESARRCGATVVATATIPVITSGRHRGRTPGGFAGWMAAHQSTG